MKKYYFTLIAFLLASVTLVAQPKLKFDNNGKFKIVQFTDSHVIGGDPKSQPAFNCVENILSFEHPDFVIFTGDQIFEKNSKEDLEKLYQLVEDQEIPFAAILGNHDDSYDLTPAEMYDIAQGFSWSVMPARTDTIFQDYTVEVMGSGSGKPEYVFYCMDTHTRSKITPFKAYDWLWPNQVQWYAKESENRDRMPALMFIHIPLPEMKTAADNAKIIGTKKENVSCSGMNSGMFLLARENGDVKGIFCGHDHNNDFSVEYLDMFMAYGRYSGGNTVYNDLKENGARVIMLDENNPSTVETWIRLSNGNLENHATFSK